MDNYYSTDNFKNVLAQYEDYMRGNNSTLLTSDDFADIAQYYHEKKDDRKAHEAADAGIRLYPGSVGPLSFKARYALLVEKDVHKAERFADRIGDLYDPDHILLNAEIMIADNRVDEAENYLENIYDSLDYDDYRDDMPLDVASLYTDYEEIDMGEHWLKRYDDPDDDFAKEVQARIYMGRGDYEKCERLLNELIDNDPYSTGYWNQLATEKMMNSDVAGSIKSSDFALAINPDDIDALNNKANGMLYLGNYEEAEKLLRRYTELEPDEDSGFIMLASALIGQNRIEEAIETLEQGLGVNFSNPSNTWQNRIEILYQLADLENMLEDYDDVFLHLDMIEDTLKDNFSDDIDSLGMALADVDVARGYTYLELERTEDAKQCFIQASISSNEDSEVLVRIGACAVNAGYVKFAYQMLHKVVYEYGVDLKQGFLYLAICCNSLGYDEEEKWARKKYLEKDLSSRKESRKGENEHNNNYD